MNIYWRKGFPLSSTPFKSKAFKASPVKCPSGSGPPNDYMTNIGIGHHITDYSVKSNVLCLNRPSGLLLFQEFWFNCPNFDTDYRTINIF